MLNQQNRRACPAFAFLFQLDIHHCRKLWLKMRKVIRRKKTILNQENLRVCQAFAFQRVQGLVSSAAPLQTSDELSCRKVKVTHIWLFTIWHFSSGYILIYLDVKTCQQERAYGGPPPWNSWEDLGSRWKPSACQRMPGEWWVMILNLGRWQQEFLIHSLILRIRI